MTSPEASDRPPRGYLFGRANHQLVRLRASLAGVEALPDSDPTKATDVEAARTEYLAMCLRMGNLWAHTCYSETKVLN